MLWIAWNCVEIYFDCSFTSATDFMDPKVLNQMQPYTQKLNFKAILVIAKTGMQKIIQNSIFW